MLTEHVIKNSKNTQMHLYLQSKIMQKSQTKSIIPYLQAQF